MNADEAKTLVAQNRANPAITDVHRSRARELLGIALGVGLTNDESAELIAGKLVQMERAAAFEAADMADPGDGRSAKAIIAREIWENREGQDHGPGRTWREYVEILVEDLTAAEDAIQKARNYIVECTNGQIGAGEDPVGFLIASHALIAAQRR